MQVLLRFSLAVDRVSRAVGKAAAWLALVMVLVGAYNALARALSKAFERRLTNNTLVEAQWYLFSLVFLLGAAWALRAGSHVRVDVVYGRLRPRLRFAVDLAAMVLFVIPFAAWAAWISIDFAARSVRLGESSNDPGGLLRWPLKCVLPAAFALLALQGMSEAIKRVALLKGHTSEAVGLDEPKTAGAREASG